MVIEFALRTAHWYEEVQYLGTDILDRHKYAGQHVERQEYRIDRQPQMNFVNLSLQ